MAHFRYLIVLSFFLVAVPKVPCTQDQEEIYQELMQLKPRVGV